MNQKNTRRWIPKKTSKSSTRKVVIINVSFCYFLPNLPSEKYFKTFSRKVVFHFSSVSFLFVTMWRISWDSALCSLQHSFWIFFLLSCSLWMRNCGKLFGWWWVNWSSWSSTVQIDKRSFKNPWISTVYRTMVVSSMVKVPTHKHPFEIIQCFLLEMI